MKLEKRVTSFVDDPKLPCEAALKKMYSLLEKYVFFVFFCFFEMPDIDGCTLLDWVKRMGFKILSSIFISNGLYYVFVMFSE